MTSIGKNIGTTKLVGEAMLPVLVMEKLRMERFCKKTEIICDILNIHVKTQTVDEEEVNAEKGAKVRKNVSVDSSHSLSPMINGAMGFKNAS